MKVANYEEILTRVRSSGRTGLVAVDGRACSGKSTLAFKLCQDLEASNLNLDDFFIPFQQQKDLRPGFPFPYFYYDLFLEGIRTLKKGEAFSFFPYDWENDSVSNNKKTVSASVFVVIEGVSALNVETVDCIDHRIFVVSDQSSQLEAALGRDGRKFESFWRSYWLPSEAAYFVSKPWTRAHHLYPGRGVEAFEIPLHLQ